MKRILIIGCSGAGKSTFAKKLQGVLDIEVIHLDQHYWKPNWEKTESEEWSKKVAQLMKGEQWIIDGNYRSTFDMRTPLADTIIWLDFPALICLYRACKRRLEQNRVDELEGCKERVSFNLLTWILWKFPTDNRRDLKKRIRNLEKEKKIIILKSNNDIELFLKEIARVKNRGSQHEDSINFKRLELILEKWVESLNPRLPLTFFRELEPSSPQTRAKNL